MTLHSALYRANRTGMAAGDRHAAEHGRIVWNLDDRAAAYRAARAVLRREGWAHVWEEPRG